MLVRVCLLLAALVASAYGCTNIADQACTDEGDCADLGLVDIPCVIAGVTNLQLNANGLESLEANSFQGLTALISLALQDNQITAIDSSAFSGLTTLQTLSIIFLSITTGPLWSPSSC
eukprot:m.614591 g.614591  ORF g.614591 m.614591 type:complete len:118 (+) comp58152_c1_seq14:95-448(+)